MKLEVGKRYLTRNGLEAVIIGRSLKTPYGEFGELIGTVDGLPGFEWRNDGRFYRLGECVNDLISEIPTGTLPFLHIGGRYVMANGKVATICDYRQGDAYPWHGMFGYGDNGGMMSWNDHGEQVNGAAGYRLVTSFGSIGFEPPAPMTEPVDLSKYGENLHLKSDDWIKGDNKEVELDRAIFDAQENGSSVTIRAEPSSDYEAAWNQDNLRVTRSTRIKNYAQSILFVLLGIAALIYSTTARARDLASMPNQAGGEIVLTDIPANTGSSHVVYSRAPNGDTIFGRWTAGKRYVVVVWDDTGTVKLFDYSDFRSLTKPPAVAERGA